MPPQVNDQGPRWVFTYNNYTPEDVLRLEQLGGNLDGAGLRYLVYGFEVGDSGTPHLQGYCIFISRKRRVALRSIIGERGHYEVSRGTPAQASDYCKKGGDYVEFGDLPVGTVKVVPKTGVTEFCNWLKELDEFPSEKIIAVRWPALWLRYQSKLVDLAVFHCPALVLETNDMRDWQTDLYSELEGTPDDRKVSFYVDGDGGTGKSWFCRYMLTKLDDKVQVLSVGKRDDLAFAVDVTKSIFLFNVPRGGMEFMQYTILEQLKDRVVFSPKYWSQTKILRSKCHVVVFCNEHPDMNKMSVDRYNVVNI